MTIAEVSYDIVAPFAGAAAKDRVSAKPTPTTRWWAARSASGIVLGFVGLLVLKDRARIKGVWVKPQERGTGLGTEITEHVINEARSLNLPMLEVFAYNPKWYEAHGWERVGTRSGVAVLVLRLEVETNGA